MIESEFIQWIHQTFAENQLCGWHCANLGTKSLIPKKTEMIDQVTKTKVENYS